MNNNNCNTPCYTKKIFSLSLSKGLPLDLLTHLHSLSAISHPMLF